MKPKVLIVDDDAAIRQQLFWMLCDDYEVTTAGDLGSALRRAELDEPEVSILDLHLPPLLDSPEVGLHVLAQLKAQRPSAKVFVVSSEDSIETKRECFRRGADGFLHKPLDVEQLIAVVRRSIAACPLAA